MEQLVGQIVPKHWCPASRLEVSKWPCEACRSSMPRPLSKNDQHAVHLAVPVHHPPCLLLLLCYCIFQEQWAWAPPGWNWGLIEEALISPPSWGLSGMTGSSWAAPCLDLGLFWSLQQPLAFTGYCDRLIWDRLPTRANSHLGLSTSFSLGPMSGSSDPHSLSITGFASGSSLSWAEGHRFWRGAQCGLNGDISGPGLCHGDRHEKRWISSFKN